MDKGIKLQAYKQRHGHDINGIRPVMIPDESGEWVSRFDAEHLAEQLQRALSRIAELEAGPHHNGMMQLSNELAEMKRKCEGLNIRAVVMLRESVRNQWLKSESLADKIYWKNMHSIANEVVEAIRAGGTVEGD